MSLDDRLLTYGGYCSQQIEATDGDKQFFEAKQAIYKDLMELIGDDIPLHQPFDDKYDYVEMGGWTIFRKGANWYKQELRKKVKKYCD